MNYNRSVFTFMIFILVLFVSCLNNPFCPQIHEGRTNLLWCPHHTRSQYVFVEWKHEFLSSCERGHPPCPMSWGKGTQPFTIELTLEIGLFIDVVYQVKEIYTYYWSDKSFLINRCWIFVKCFSESLKWCYGWYSELLQLVLKCQIKFTFLG